MTAFRSAGVRRFMERGRNAQLKVDELVRAELLRPYRKTRLSLRHAMRKAARMLENGGDCDQAAHTLRLALRADDRRKG